MRGSRVSRGGQRLHERGWDPWMASQCPTQATRKADGQTGEPASHLFRQLDSKGPNEHTQPVGHPCDQKASQSCLSNTQPEELTGGEVSPAR